MKLSSYIEDQDISKLQAKGIKIVSPVYRRAIPGTQVANGTRFLKFVFPPGFVALPYFEYQTFVTLLNLVRSKYFNEADTFTDTY